MKKECPTLKELVFLRDNELDEKARSATLGHLNGCLRCRERYHNIKSLDQLLLQGDPAAIADGTPHFSAHASQKPFFGSSGPRPVRFLRRGFAWVGLAACLLLCLCLFLFTDIFQVEDMDREVSKEKKRVPFVIQERDVKERLLGKKEKGLESTTFPKRDEKTAKNIAQNEKMQMRRKRVELEMNEYLELLSREGKGGIERIRRLDEAEVSYLLRKVEGGEEPFLSQAIYLLAARRESRAVKSLTLLAKRGVQERDSIVALGRIGYEKALSFLKQQALEGTFPEESLRAIAQIDGRVGREALEGLAMNEGLRPIILQLLVEEEGRKASELAVKIALRFPGCPSALAALGNLELYAGDFLLGRLRTGKGREVSAAIELLGKLEEKRAAEVLFSMVKAGKYVEQAILALGRIGGTRGTEALLYLVDRVDSSVLIRGARELNDQEMESLKQKTLERNRYIGEKSLRLLSLLREKSCLPLFTSLIEKGLFREEAIRAVCRVGGEEALAALNPYLDNPKTGSVLVRAVAQEEGETALEVLGRAAGKKELQKRALALLSRRGDASKASPAVVKLMEKQKRKAGVRRQVPQRRVHKRGSAQREKGGWKSSPKSPTPQRGGPKTPDRNPRPSTPPRRRR